jgi:hypothetical protein
MARKKKTPAAVATAVGANDAAHAEGLARANYSTRGERPHPKKLALRPRPGHPEFWLIVVDDLPEFPIRRTKLPAWRRFRNITVYHTGASFPVQASANWMSLVKAAVAAEGGGAP